MRRRRRSIGLLERVKKVGNADLFEQPAVTLGIRADGIIGQKELRLTAVSEDCTKAQERDALTFTRLPSLDVEF